MKSETRTDFVGTYTAYLFADGHVETDPPGRPQSREDAQRERRRQLATADPRRQLQAAAPLDRVLQPFQRTSAALAEIATTVQAVKPARDELLTTVDLGGSDDDMAADVAYDDTDTILTHVR